MIYGIRSLTLSRKRERKSCPNLLHSACIAGQRTVGACGVSSHSGTGRFFERRKSGLNIFD